MTEPSVAVGPWLMAEGVSEVEVEPVEVESLSSVDYAEVV